MGTPTYITIRKCDHTKSCSNVDCRHHGEHPHEWDCRLVNCNYVGEQVCCEYVDRITKAEFLRTWRE